MDGDTPVINGVIVKFPPPTTTPETVTESGPEVALAGTGAMILPPLQLVGAAGIPLKLTLLVPCDAPKPLPLTVTDVPTGPTDGDKPEIVGGMAKVPPLTVCPEIVATSGPPVA